MPGNNDAEIVSRLREIGEAVARIDERTRSWADSHADHERRIKNLEIENAKRKGAMAAVSSLGGLIGAGVMWLIKQLFGGGN